jgi:hypothetical protein
LNLPLSPADGDNMLRSKKRHPHRSIPPPRTDHPEPKAQDSSKRWSRSETIQLGMTFATFLLFLAAMYQAHLTQVYSDRTLERTDTSLTLTKRAMDLADSSSQMTHALIRAELRPYVLLKSRPPANIKLDETSFISFLITNVGKTPASNLAIRSATLALFPKGISNLNKKMTFRELLSYGSAREFNEKDFDLIKHIDAHTAVMAPNQEIRTGEMNVGLTNKDFMYAESLNIVKRYAVGIITYADKFGTQYTTRFCFYYDLKNGWTINKRFNDMN